MQLWLPFNMLNSNKNTSNNLLPLVCSASERLLVFRTANKTHENDCTRRESLNEKMLELPQNI